MSQWVQLEDEGVAVIIEITESDGSTPFNISTASVKEIWFGAPSGEAKKKTADFVTDGSDGQLSYVLVEGDIDEEGEWDVQAYWVTSGNKRHSTVEQLEVRKNVG
jgi:hypothetical protein